MEGLGLTEILAITFIRQAQFEIAYFNYSDKRFRIDSCDCNCERRPLIALCNTKLKHALVPGAIADEA